MPGYSRCSHGVDIRRKSVPTKRSGRKNIVEFEITVSSVSSSQVKSFEAAFYCRLGHERAAATLPTEFADQSSLRVD